MRSLTLFSIGKCRGCKAYGLAWIPCLWVWPLGAIADKYDTEHGMNRHWRWAMLILTIMSLVSATFYIIYLTDFIETASASVATNDMNTFFAAVLPIYASVIPLSLVSGTNSVCSIICMFKLYESSKPKAALRILLIATLVPFAAPFCLLSCRNWDNGVRLSKPIKALPEETPSLFDTKDY